MTPRPLRRGFLVLAAALWAGAASAADVIVVPEGVPTQAPGTPVAGVGAAGPAAVPGVAPITSLPTGLSAPAAAPLASAAPSAAAALPAAAAAPFAAAPSAAIGAAPAAKPPAKTGKAKPAPYAPDYGAHEPSKPVFGPASVSAATAHEHGHGVVSGKADLAALTATPAASAAKASAVFDGSKIHDPAVDGPSEAPPPTVPVLKPLAKSGMAAPASGPEVDAKAVVAAPQPVSPTWSEKLDAKAGVWWAKVKGAVAGNKGASATTSPQVQARIEKLLAPRLRRVDDPLENEDGLLVHAPRALRFDALGYRVHFAAPEGAPAASVADQPVRVRLERDPNAQGLDALNARLAAFNALIEENFAALEIIAQSSSKMNVKSARLFVSKVEAMAHFYAEMVGRQQALDYVAGVAGIAIGFDQEVKGLGDNDLLPPKAVELIMPIDKESAHYFLNRLHRAAVMRMEKGDDQAQPNLVVKLGRGATERSVPLVDASYHPLTAGGRIVSPAFKALVEAMSRSKDTPKGSLILQDHQFWGHFRLGAHSAEVSANFLPPDEGGMLRVRYQEWGTGYDNQTRLYYVARLLQKTGFHVEQDNGFLTAVVDKDHASQTVDQMTDTFALVIQALHATVGIDFALPLLVQGAKTSEEVGRRIDEWVDVVLGEGTLPFYIRDDHNGMVAGWSSYQGQDRERAALRRGLDKALARLGLPGIPAEERLGQRTIDRFFNAAIEAAIARGELVFDAHGRLARAPGFDPLAGLARAVAEAPRESARMAEVVSSLDPGLFRFEPIGSLGTLVAERAERRLAPGGVLVVHSLRDPKTGQLAFAEAELSDLKPGRRPAAVGPARLFELLAEQGYPVAPFSPSAQPPGLERFLGQLKTPPLPSRSMGHRAQGLAASPAHGRPVLARVTYDKAKAAKGGLVFVAAYTTPDDLDAIRASKAVITTSGGLLSHAAITTREMGVPAVILPGADWRGGVASFESPEFGKSYALGGLAARRAKAATTAALPEGALVRMDPATGAVEMFPEGTSAALLDAAQALERYDRERDGRFLVSWARHRLGLDSLSSLQKAALVRETLDGLAARAAERPEVASDLAVFYESLPKDDGALAQWASGSAMELLREETRAAAEEIDEKRAAVAQAISLEAVERAARQGEARAVRAQALAAAFRFPKSGMAPVFSAAERLREEAKARASTLLAEDVEELKAHARAFPNATVEVLPRLKAAIAKARRRGAPADLIRAWEAQARALESSRERAMSAAAPVVLPLDQVLDMDVTRVGGKAAKLGEITEVVARAGGRVPPGLALTVDAYRAFLRESGIAEKLDRVAADPELSPEDRASRAQKLILDAPLSADSGVGRAIVSALKARGLDGAMLAVRSSAVDEDGAEAAFAGAGDTHLYVAPKELLPHVKEIWASLWNARAMLYRQTKGLSTDNLAQAVVIQEMVDSQVSGVAFTADPVSGDSSRLVVNGAFGLGEGVVSGRVAPDQYVVGKRLGREILPPMIADKKLAVIRAKSGLGTEERKMPPEWRRRRAMTPARLEKLNAVAVALEAHFGYPLDIEFGFVEDQLFILQARPVTNAAPEEAPVPEIKTAKAAAASPAKAEAAEPRRLMFVCTGNTCRSPMAERLAKDKLAREGRSGFEVLSRGLSVPDAGAPMTRASQQVLAERGVHADGHAALPFMDSDAIWADVILTMTAGQAQALEKRFPHARGKVRVLGEYAGTGGDIADPFGGGVDDYRKAAAQIAAGVDAALDRVESRATAAR